MVVTVHFSRCSCIIIASIKNDAARSEVSTDSSLQEEDEEQEEGDK